MLTDGGVNVCIKLRSEIDFDSPVQGKETFSHQYLYLKNNIEKILRMGHQKSGESSFKNKTCD